MADICWRLQLQEKSVLLDNKQADLYGAKVCPKWNRRGLRARCISLGKITLVSTMTATRDRYATMEIKWPLAFWRGVTKVVSRRPSTGLLARPTTIYEYGRWCRLSHTHSEAGNQLCWDKGKASAAAADDATTPPPAEGSPALHCLCFLRTKNYSESDSYIILESTDVPSFVSWNLRPMVQSEKWRAAETQQRYLPPGSGRCSQESRGKPR